MLRTTETESEVQCPRDIQAAMTAAASFGPRRSGKYCERHRRERPTGPHQWGMALLGPSRRMLCNGSAMLNSGRGGAGA